MRWCVVLVGLAACGVRSAPSLDESLARYNRFVRHEYGDSIALLYAPDGELGLPGRAPVRGPDSIRTFLASFTAVRVDSSAMWVDSISVTDSGVVQYGGYYQQATVEGQPPVRATGRFVALWRLRPDGYWLLRRMRT